METELQHVVIQLAKEGVSLQKRFMLQRKCNAQHGIPVIMKALKCKTLGGILRCRLTNALSRQLALLAEPKNPLDSTMSTSSGFFVHTMKHCYATALYTTEAQALSITHARISLPHACNHERSIRKECGK